MCVAFAIIGNLLVVKLIGRFLLHFCRWILSIAGGSPTGSIGDPTKRVTFRADIWPDKTDVPAIRFVAFRKKRSTSFQSVLPFQAWRRVVLLPFGSVMLGVWELRSLGVKVFMLKTAFHHTWHILAYLLAHWPHPFSLRPNWAVAQPTCLIPSVCVCVTTCF